ncbi:MAG TPA: hypothetical protein VFR48_05240 [Solirubrobacteraceae bacterium]|nr:hypothetical protein [Solirubrobacteraceae bacterium]
MGSATATQSGRDVFAGRAAVLPGRGPLLALLGGLSILAVGVGLIAAHVTVFALDETLIEQSAVHYTSGLPHTLVHDLDARATNRLYPLLLSIPLRLFDGVQALRVDHVLSVLLFLSAAVPIFLMARVLLRSSWLAVAVALLSVAVPWLTLTSALFTENLSYPLFWWMILATAAAIWQPAPGRDLLALVTIGLLIATRVQFAAVFIGYLLTILLSCYHFASAHRLRPLSRVRAAIFEIARCYPLSMLLLVGTLALLLHEKLSGRWHAHVEALLGGYSNVVIRNGLPANMGQGLLVELIALALGVGLLPAIVSIAWFVRRMANPQLDRRWVYVAAPSVVIAVFLVLTVYAQGGYLGSMTEERYFFYAIPVFWLGTFAALEDRSVRSKDLLFVAAGLALIYATIPFLSPLSQETAFLDPVESVVPHVFTPKFSDIGLTGLTMQDALGLLALAAGALTAWLWARRHPMRAWWTVIVAVVAQLLLTGYAFAVIDGKVLGIPGRTTGSVPALGWIDAHAGAANVMWLNNVSTAAPPTNFASSVADQLRTALFWNSSIRSWIQVSATGLPPVEVPMAALPGSVSTVDASTGLLSSTRPAALRTNAVGANDSPFLQLEGTQFAHSPDGVLALTRVKSPLRATWIAQGLQPDGGLPVNTPVLVTAFVPRSPRPAQASALRVTFTFEPAPPQPGSTGIQNAQVAINLAGATRRGALVVGSHATNLTLRACLAAGRTHARGEIKTIGLPTALPISVRLERVDLSWGACIARH